MDRLEDKHILITGGGAPGAGGIISAIKKHSKVQVSSCDIKTGVVGQVFADDFFTVLGGNDPNYIEDLISKIKDRKIDLILPITTRELFPLSRNKRLFRDMGIAVMVSDFEWLSIANDKGKLLDHLKRQDIPTPEYQIARDQAEALNLLEAFSGRFESFVFKPCVSNGSRGFRAVRKTWNAADQLLNEKPGSALIKPEHARAMLKEIPNLPPFVFMENLPGEEYSVDCLVIGKESLIIPRLRSKINNGISVEGIITKNREIISYCRSVLQCLDLYGPIGIQVKMNMENKPMLLEINPRLQGSSVACMGAGINLPLLAAETGLGFAVNLKEEEKNIKWETKFVRYYTEAFIDG